jgi:hypothetical protein
MSLSRLLPITARLRGKLVGNIPISCRASERIELSPAVHRVQRAALSLPHELGRVIAFQEETTREVELSRLAEGTRMHGPTMAYRIDDAVMAQGAVYFRRGYDVINKRLKRLLLPRKMNHFREALLCTNHVVERYFGHWLLDGLALELLAAERAVLGLKFSGRLWLHEPGYRQLCGLEISRADYACIDRLWVVDDRGLNNSWISRVTELRRRVRSEVPPGGGKLVMLARGSLGVKRNLINSAEVSEALDRLGFAIIDPETEKPSSLAAKLSNAEIGITIEGSVQSHFMIAMPSGSTVLAIQPPARFNSIHKGYADAIGLNWGFVVADPHADGFHLPIDRLLRLLDEVIKVRHSLRN